MEPFVKSNASMTLELGRVLATPGALGALAEAEQGYLEFLSRHVNGDWGEVDSSDAAENELSLKEGFRILSAYRLTTGVKLWLITAAARTATRALPPEAP